MNHLRAEKETFEHFRAQLEKEHSADDWVVVHDTELVGVFPTLDEAATTAIGQYGRGPYLIRQIVEHPIMLPGSMMAYEQAKPITVPD